MNRWTRQSLTIVLAIAVLGIAGFAQTAPDADEIAPLARVLLIDETRTFASTMRVGALAGALRQGGVDLEVRLEPVPTSYVDPLAEASSPDASFDLILIVPIGIEDGSVGEVWLLHGSSLWASPGALESLAPLRGLLAAVFDGIAVPVGPGDDLWIACLASLYESQGWLR